MPQTPDPGPDAPGAPAARRSDERDDGRDDDPVLPSVSRDETELGWGDEPSERDDDWYRRERPPHHE